MWETWGKWFGYLKKYKHIFLLALFLAMAVFAKSKAGERLAAVFSEKENKKASVVVLDAGHGGFDPGKVGCSGVLEKDINLAIAKKLQARLTQDGIQVIMTRESDEGLNSDTSQNKKREDMEARVRIISESEPDFVVSIHQNNFTDSRYSGAQVFYASTQGSEQLAKELQSTLISSLNKGSNRKSKQCDGVYLMEHISCPGVLVECGFLSNPQEEARLRSLDYQRKLCCVIAATVSGFLAVFICQ